MNVDWRRVLTVELALLAGCALAVVAWTIAQRFLHTLVLLLMATVVAFALGPLVERVEERVGRRALAVALVYVALLVVVVGGVTLLAAPFVGQATALLGDLPSLGNAAKTQAPAVDARLRQLGLPVTVDDLQTRLSGAVSESASVVLGGTLAVLTGLTNFVVDLVLTLVMSLYLVLDGQRLRDGLVQLVPAGRREQAAFVEDTVVRIAGGYLRGQLVMALSIGVLAGVGALIFGLRYPVVIAVMAGVFELVPMFGPIIGAVPALLAALLQPFPTVLWVALYFLAIQQVESNVLAPRITGHAVGLHPLGAMVALLAGFEAAGVFGALFAVPVAAVLWVLVGAVYRRLRYGEVQEPEPPRRGWRLPPFRRAA